MNDHYPILLVCPTGRANGQQWSQLPEDNARKVACKVPGLGTYVVTGGGVLSGGRVGGNDPWVAPAPPAHTLAPTKTTSPHSNPAAGPTSQSWPKNVKCGQMGGTVGQNGPKVVQCCHCKLRVGEERGGMGTKFQGAAAELQLQWSLSPQHSKYLILTFKF